MQEYAARVCPDGRIQTVKEHTLGVCQKAKSDARMLKAESIIELVCLLHDMGKNTENSNTYQHTVGAGNLWNGEKPIHSHAGARLIYERYFQNKKSDRMALILSELTEAVIMSHHGLFDCIGTDGQNKLYNKIQNNKYDYEEAKRELFFRIVSPEKLDNLFKCAENEFRAFLFIISQMTSEKSECRFYISMLYRMLLSILVNADHSDAAEFSEGGSIAPEYDGNLIWQSCSVYFEDALSAFKNETPIQKIRSEISRLLLEQADKEQTIVRLTIPTGGGKTLSSLRYALNYAKRFGKSRIIYVAPFNSILEQNASEYRRFLPADTDILEHFGDMIDDKEDGSDYRYYTENWGSPVIVTSMVQFFNTLFLGKISSVRRMRGLLNSVIILDEIQSVPVKCISLFNMAMNFLAGICHCTVVLCSATQPTLWKDVKHQIRLSSQSELIDNHTINAEPFRRTRIIDSMRTNGFTCEEAADFVMKQAESVKSVLLIVNTKGSAKAVYSFLRERLSGADCLLVHLSTHMCPVHRKAALSMLKERLDSGKKVICVSTQLIEAGVDISFEMVIRSLAGLDSIIQSAGRCNRNGETDVGFVHIINITDENISKISTIKVGAEITKRMLMTMRKNPELYRGDITCEEAVRFYYQDYFEKMKNELDFSAKAGDVETTLFRLLSTNKNVINKMGEENINKINGVMNQSFQTAGEVFRVIDEYGNSVLVPYGKGKEYINELCGDYPPKPSAALLRKLQPYAIGLSDKECKDRVVRNEKTGILILKEGFYNSEVGFDPDGQQELLLI